LSYKIRVRKIYSLENTNKFKEKYSKPSHSVARFFYRSDDNKPTIAEKLARKVINPNTVVTIEPIATPLAHDIAFWGLDLFHIRINIAPIRGKKNPNTAKPAFGAS
jgi:hypothetical protein